MSLDATRWAWEQPLKPTCKLILLSLADRAGETHECWPSTERLVRDTGLHRDTVFAAVKELESKEILRVTRIHGKGNKYQLIGVSERHQSKDFTSTKNHTGMENCTDTKNHTSQSGKPDRYQSGFPDTESINKPISNKSKNIKGKLREFGITGQLADDFITHRKTKKAAITTTVLNSFQREADKAGVSLKEALTISIERNWQSFKAEWLTNSKTSASNQPRGISRDEWNSTDF